MRKGSEEVADFLEGDKKREEKILGKLSPKDRADVEKSIARLPFVRPNPEPWDEDDGQRMLSEHFGDI